MRTRFSLIALAAAALALTCPLAGCGTTSAPANHPGKKVIYTTFFPVQDLTSRIVGDKMEVKTIISGNQEPHDFELNTQDMAKITDADLVIYNGAGMESFVDALKESVGDEDRFLDLSQGLTLLEGTGHDHDHDHDADDHDGHDHEADAQNAEEHDGHEHEADEHGDHGHDADGHDHDADADEHDADMDGHDADDDDHEHGSVNPHTWLSIKNAEVELDTIYQKVAAMDPDNETYYRENLDRALADFQALDKRFEDAIAQVPAERRVFVTSHAAFNYLAHDYGLKQVAVTGISPEDEPTAAQLATISDFMKSNGVDTIFFEGKATPKVAETLAASAHAKTATLYTMESLTEDEAKLGYLTLMERNLDALMESFDAR